MFDCRVTTICCSFSHFSPSFTCTLLLPDYFKAVSFSGTMSDRQVERFPRRVSEIGCCDLLQMVRMSTGHMEGDLQPLYLLLTDAYIYMLRKGKRLKGFFRRLPLRSSMACFQSLPAGLLVMMMPVLAKIQKPQSFSRT